MVAKPLDEEAIFKIAAGIPLADTRSDYLQQVCRDDDALLNRVLTLLRAHDNAPNFLEFPPPGIFPTGVPASVTGSSGAQIGPYKLREQIGEGGMGMVYVAEQTEPVRRRVALKIIKPGMATKDVVARFEAERQALAMMDHPNIARVFDGGATDNGQPFFVMELVLGVPITEHCDEARLTTEERIELFIDVCHAVQHAHQQGIIHRDIKPDNVMVTVADGRLIPKVIDFGIAKATQKRLTERASLTSDGQFLGTPQYMSPEQAGMSDLHVDIRTDVYSLGVLLYELLVSNTPFDPKRLREASYDEICRIIRDTDPPTPSKQLSTLGAAAAEETSKQRKVPPNVLQKQLRGDLDCIVMKTLEKDRDRRYDTAEALADDLRRFLDDKPIEAKRPTRTERVAKWSRRHRWGVATSVAVALAALLGGLVLAWYGQRREAEQRVRAEQNLRLALAAVDQIYLEYANVKFGSLLADARPAEKQKLQPEAETFLSKALTFYEQFAQANHNPVAVRYDTATAYGRIGNIRRQLGMYYNAQLAFAKGAEIAEGLIRESPTVAKYKECLAQIRMLQGIAYGHRGNLQQGIAALSQAIRLNPEYAEAYHLRGQAYASSGDFKHALADYDQSVRISARLYPTIPFPCYYRGAVYLKMGDFDKAIADFDTAIQLNPEFPVPHASRGFAYLQKGDHARAIADLSEALLLDPDRATAKAAYTHRARAYMKQRDYARAVVDVSELVRTEPDNPFHYSNRGLIYTYQGDFDRALADFNHCLKLAPGFVAAYGNRGSLYVRMDDFAKALSDFNEAIRRDPKSADVYCCRGEMYIEQGQFDKGNADLAQAVDLNPERAVIYSKQALALLASGQTECYQASCARMLQRFEASQGADDQFWTAWTCALAPHAVDELAAAVALANKVVHADPGSIHNQRALGAILFRAGRIDEAIARLAEANRLAQTSDPPPEFPPVYTLYFLAMARHADGRQVRIPVDQPNFDAAVGVWLPANDAASADTLLPGSSAGSIAAVESCARSPFGGTPAVEIEEFLLKGS